jgi:hypothetical protein
MEVGGQQRVMRLVFTGLIHDPETECREWFTAINGYPPERTETTAVHLDEPAQTRQPEQIPARPEVSEQPVVQPPPVYVQPPAEVSPPAPSPAAVPPVPEPVVPESVPLPVSPSPGPLTREAVRTTQVSEGSVHIVVEKPDLSPLHVRPKPPGDGGSGTKTFRYCIHCGARTPSHARFCQVCGNSQT